MCLWWQYFGVYQMFLDIAVLLTSFLHVLQCLMLSFFVVALVKVKRATIGHIIPPTTDYDGYIIVMLLLGP